MEFSLSSDQRLLVEAVQHAVEWQIQPILDRELQDRPLSPEASREIMKHGANLGLTSARLPESAGGAGISCLDYGLMAEQLPTAALFVTMPQETTVNRIFHSSTQEQKERFLPDLISGSRLTCTAATEPGVGSDPRGIATLAVEEGDKHQRSENVDIQCHHCGSRQCYVPNGAGRKTNSGSNIG